MRKIFIISRTANLMCAIFLIFVTTEFLTYGMHCPIILSLQGMSLVSNAAYEIMQTTLEMTFLPLVTIR